MQGANLAFSKASIMHLSSALTIASALTFGAAFGAPMNSNGTLSAGTYY